MVVPIDTATAERVTGAMEPKYRLGSFKTRLCPDKCLIDRKLQTKNQVI